MNRIQIQFFQTPYGELVLGSFDQQLCMCDWRYRKKRKTVDHRLEIGLNATFREEDNQVLKSAREQLEEYFDGKRRDFELPLLLVGTEFQKNVWTGLMQVPFGTTWSYLELAQKIDKKKAVRAVSNANGANAISILIPCHRILGSQGQLVGYAGGLCRWATREEKVTGTRKKYVFLRLSDLSLGSCWLLLREAVDGAMSPDKVGGVNANDLSFGKEVI